MTLVLRPERDGGVGPAMRALRAEARHTRRLHALLVHVGLPGHAHADALVQMRRARLVAGVDAETDAALPPTIELAERGQEQRPPDSIPAPGLADPDRPDPTDSEPQCVDLCSDHLVTRTNQVDERWVPPIAPEDGALPIV